MQYILEYSKSILKYYMKKKFNRNSTLISINTLR